MRNYIALPSYEVPRNALLDFSPISQGFDKIRQQSNHNAAVGRELEEQRYQRGRNAVSDARAAESHSAALQDRNDARQQNFIKQTAGLAQLIDTEQDPSRRQQMWGRLIGSDRRFHDGLTKYGLDPSDHINGPKFLIAQARGYQDPQAAPRPEVKEVNGRLVRISPDGTATEIYDGGQPQQDAPSGYRWGADGSSLEPIPGGPASGAKKDLKEYQTKDAMFAERLLRSDAIIDSVAGVDASGKPKPGAYNPSRKSNAWFPDDGYLGIPNLVNSTQWQQYQNAAREGIAAILRKDTGAAVTQTEWDLYFPMLYPQPGDGPEAVAQKKQRRAAASQALRASSGPAFDVMFPTGPVGMGQQGGAAEPGNFDLGDGFSVRIRP